MGFLVGARSVTGAVDSIALPVGTEPDDLLILSLLGGWAEEPPIASCSDPRMTRIGPTDPMATRDAGVWVGNADDSLAPLDVHLRGTSGQPIGQFAVGHVAAYRNRYVVPDSVNWSSLTGEGGGTGEIPNMGRRGDGAVAVLHASAGFGGVSVDWSPSLYIPDTAADNSYVRTDVAVAMGQPGACPPPNVSLYWRVINFRFTDRPEAPVTRLYPRDDALGLGSAPRIYPPPTASRLHGGLR